MGLLRTILIILLIYFGLKILSRIFAPLLLRFVAKKAEQRFGDQFGGFQNQNNRQNDRRKEGETVIDKMPNKSKNSNDKEGEYIDYEEIEKVISYSFQKNNYFSESFKFFIIHVVFFEEISSASFCFTRIRYFVIGLF